MVKSVHNSQYTKYREPNGAVTAGTAVRLCLLVSDCDEVLLVCRYNQESREDVREMHEYRKKMRFCLYSVLLEVPCEPGLVFYYFLIRKDGRSFFCGNNNDAAGGRGQMYEDPEAVVPYQITVYEDEKEERLKWFEETVVYQIFPDRFDRTGFEKNICSADQLKKNALLHLNWEDDPEYIKDEKGAVEYWDFFGGTFEGIGVKSVYLRDLGIGTVYLNPIFEAESNHRYDTADYMKPDPLLGSLEDWCGMRDALAENGIRLVLDGVFSHTGSNSLYFNRKKVFGDGGAYNDRKSPYRKWYLFDKHPEEYKCWWGFPNLPSLDKNSDEVRKFIYRNRDSIVRYWLKQGISGWRLDVADELPDDFIQGIKKALLEENREAVLIGEVWEDASNKISYGVLRKYFSGRCLDSVTNYLFRNTFADFLNGDISGREACRVCRRLFENYPLPAARRMINILSSHDIPRALGILSGDSRAAFRKFKALVLMQMVFPGVPHVYYGDETGMTGGTDPQNRRTFPRVKENAEIFEWYKKSIAFRTENASFFRDADYNAFSPRQRLFVLKRKLGEKVLCAVLNAGSSEELFRPCNYIWEAEGIIDLVNEIQFLGNDSRDAVPIPPFSVGLFASGGFYEH